MARQKARAPRRGSPRNPGVTDGVLKPRSPDTAPASLPDRATLEAIHKVTAETVWARRVQEVLEALVRQAVELLRGNGGGFYLADHARQELRCVVSVGTPTVVLGTVLAFGEGASGRVAVTGEPLNIEDYRTWSGRSPQFEDLSPFRAVISAPTRWEDRVTGVLHVLRSTSDTRFSADDLELLALLASHAGALLENARLLEESNRRVRQLSHLTELTRAALGARDLKQMSQALAERMAELVGADTCHLTLWDTDRGVPRPMAVSGDLRDDYSLERPQAGRPGLTESALQAGRPLPVEDLRSSDLLAAESAASCPYASMLAVPLISADRWMGAVLLGYREPHRFADEEIALCQQASGQVAMALALVDAYESERRRRNELEGVRRASLRMTSTLDLNPVLQALLVETLNLVGAYDAHIFLYDGARLHFGAALWDDEFHASPYAEPREDGLTMRVACSGQVIVITDTSEHALYADDPWEGSLVGLPIRAGGEVRGVMTVAFREPRAITDAGLRVMELFADQAGIAIENARLYAASDAERQRIRLLFEIGRETAGSLDADEILRRAVRLATEHLKASRGSAFVLDPESGRLELKAVAPPPAVPVEEQDRSLGLRLGRGLAGWVAEQRQVALVPDLVQDDRWIDLPGRKQGGAAIGVPLLDRDQVLGVLIVVAERELGEDDQQLMQGIGRQVALALANAQRYRQVTRRLAERTALQQVAQVVSRRLEIDPLLDEVVHQVSDVLGYPVVEVFLVEDQELVLRAANLPESLGTKRLALDRGVIGRALRTRQPVYVPVVQQDDDYIVGVASTRSEIAVPLFSGEIVVGVLNVETPDEGALTSEDLNLLTLLGDQVSVALENAALVERLRLHAQELRETVSARTGELQRALEQSVQADQLKTRFVADVSHELRTPLTNIRLYLDLLEKGRSEKFPDYLETLHRETGRLVDLIEDLLMVSRLDAGTAEMTPTWIDLNSLAHSLVEDRRRLVGQMNLTIDLETQGDLPLVRADERMISQVVANLLTNAVNYTPPGGAIVVRTDTIGDGEMKWARLAVVDTGVGIPENELPRLFERFFRGSASRIRGVSGTGLGLAICEEILERHGGRITAASRSAEGSTFTIWLPAQRVSEVGEVSLPAE